MEIKIAICDDESIQLDNLTKMLHNWNHKINVSLFSSAEAFLFQYFDNKSYDILLLDIEMGDMNGIDLARRIRENNDYIQIIFITGYTDFISEGYDVSALHYLIKPVEETKLFNVLNRAVNMLNKIEKTVFLRSVNKESIPVTANKIMYIECFAHYTEIILSQSDKITVKMSLREAEQLFDNFIKCHRSYVVNIRHIKKITKTDVILDDDTIIPLSRRLYDNVNQAVMKYCTEDI